MRSSTEGLTGTDEEVATASESRRQYLREDQRIHIRGSPGLRYSGRFSEHREIGNR